MSKNQASKRLEKIFPPIARRVKKTRVLHGMTLVDNYAWLKNKTSSAVKKYLNDENDYTGRMMRPSLNLQNKIYKEILGRIKETDMDVPYRNGEYTYYSKIKKGNQYRTFYRKRKGSNAKETELLNCNALAAGKAFFSLGLMDVSPNSNILAYTTDYSGFRTYCLYFTDLERGLDLSDCIPNVRTFAWGGDSKCFFYVTEDKSKRACKVWKQHLDFPERKTLVYEEEDCRYSVSVNLSGSKKYIFILSASATSTEVRVVDADKEISKLHIFKPRQKDIEYYLDHGDNYFYVLINDRGRNFRVARVPTYNSEGDLEEIMPHRVDVMIDNMEVFSDFLVLHERDRGVPNINILNFESGDFHKILVGEVARSISSGDNADFYSKFYRYEYQSFVTPRSTFDYLVSSNTSSLLKQQEVGLDYDPQQYTVKIIEAKAKDGTLVPISIVYKTNLKRKVPQALVLSGYGAYGYSNDVYFSAARLSLLDRGVIFGISHVRGGGEMGQVWHDQGRMLSKENTFTDFIVCADELCRLGYTSPSKMVIEGGSAGGLLIGAVINMRPDLCRGAVLQVPFVDVMNTMLDDKLPLTTGEYEEWGNPGQDINYFETILGYSPYDQLKETFYPAMLVETSFNDSQVMYWEPAKYVAKLRSLKQDTANPLLLRTNMEAGHGGASGRYDWFKEVAFTYSFILGVLGILN